MCIFAHVSSAFCINDNRFSACVGYELGWAILGSTNRGEKHCSRQEEGQHHQHIQHVEHGIDPN